MRPLPDHWEKNPMETRMIMRWRLPGVFSSSVHDPFSYSISVWMVSQISLYSILTRSSSSSPSAWTCARVFFAWSNLPFEMSQRGDSGTIL